MNCWNLTGIVKNFGEKGSKFKKLWINIELVGSDNPSNTVFINFDLDNQPSTKKYKVGQYVVSTLEKGKNIFINDITLSLIKFSKKLDDGSWTDEEKLGLKANIGNITFLDSPSLTINTGFLKGKVVSHTNDRIIVEHSYRNPIDNTWKTRPIPVLIKSDINYMFKDKNLVGNQVFVNGEINSNDKLFYVLAKQMLVL